MFGNLFGGDDDKEKEKEKARREREKEHEREKEKERVEVVDETESEAFASTEDPLQPVRPGMKPSTSTQSIETLGVSTSTVVRTERVASTHLVVETQCGGAVQVFVISSLRGRCDTQVVSICPLTACLIYTGTKDLDLFASESAALAYLTQTRGLEVTQRTRALGIAGYLNGRLALITGSKRTAVLPCGAGVFTVTASKWIIVAAHALHTPASYQRDTELLQAFPLEAHFYSETLDLTTVYPPQQYTHESAGRTSTDEGDGEFHWNKEICEDFYSLGLGNWCLCLLQGYAESKELPAWKDEDGVETKEHMCMIARKSKRHPGPRYIARGLGDEGYPANEVEVQIIVWREDGGSWGNKSAPPRLGSPPLPIPGGKSIPIPYGAPSNRKPAANLLKNERKYKQLTDILLREEHASSADSEKEQRSVSEFSDSDSDSDRSGEDSRSESSTASKPAESETADFETTRKRAMAIHPQQSVSCSASSNSSSSNTFAQLFARQRASQENRRRRCSSSTAAVDVPIPGADDSTGMFGHRDDAPLRMESVISMATTDGLDLTQETQDKDKDKDKDKEVRKDAWSFATHVFRRGTIPLRWGTELQGGAAGRAVGKANIVLDSEPSRGAAKYFEYLQRRFPGKLLSVITLLHTDQDHAEHPLSQAYLGLVNDMNDKGLNTESPIPAHPLTGRNASASQAAAQAVAGRSQQPPPAPTMTFANAMLAGGNDDDTHDGWANSSVPSVADAPETKGQSVTMMQFDWHKTTKVYGLEGAPEMFWKETSDMLNAQGFTAGVLRKAEEGHEADLVEHQKALCRINCADSLDRTNGCAFLMEVRVAGEMLRHLRRASRDRSRGLDPLASENPIYRELRSVADARQHIGEDVADILVDLFLNCGDLLSELYTGTPAAFSEIIRQFASGAERARHSNAMLSVMRRYQNVVTDAARADSFTAFLCKSRVTNPQTRLCYIPGCFAIRSSPPLPLDMLSDTGRQVWEMRANATKSVSLFNIVISLPPMPYVHEKRARISHIALCLRNCGTPPPRKSLTPALLDVYAGLRLDELHPILTGETMPVTDDMTWVLYEVPATGLSECARLIQLKFQGDECGMCIGEMRVLCEVPPSRAAVTPLWMATGSSCSASVPHPICYCTEQKVRNRLCHPGSYVAQVSPVPEKTRDPNCVLERFMQSGDVQFPAKEQECCRMLIALNEYTLAQSCVIRCSAPCRVWIGMGLTEDNLTHSGTMEVTLKGGFRRNTIDMGGRGLRTLFCKFVDVEVDTGELFAVRRIELLGRHGMLPGNCGWLNHEPAAPIFHPVAKCTQSVGADPLLPHLPPTVELRFSKLHVPGLRFKPLLTDDDPTSQVKRVRVSIFSHGQADPTLTRELTLPLTVPGSHLDFRFYPTRGIRVCLVMWFLASFIVASFFKAFVAILMPTVDSADLNYFFIPTKLALKGK